MFSPFPLLGFLFLLLTSQCTSFVIHPNCRAFKDFPANTQTYLYTLQNIVNAAKFLSIRAATQITGNWVNTNSAQATYNRNAVPGNDQMTQIEGWLQTVNQFDWSTGLAVSQKQKRAVPSGSIVINCQPEQLKVTINRDYPQGIYYDTSLQEYVLKTPAMDACMGIVDGGDPILQVQKSVVGQNTFYTIFVCAAAKSTGVFEPKLTAYNFIQAVADAAATTMFARSAMSGQEDTSWNLGPTYALTNYAMIDTMFLAALVSIAQQAQTYTVYNHVAPGSYDPWAATFQAGTQYWDNPMCVATWTLASYLLVNGVPVNSQGYVGGSWDAPTQVAAVLHPPPSP